MVVPGIVAHRKNTLIMINIKWLALSNAWQCREIKKHTPNGFMPNWHMVLIFHCIYRQLHIMVRFGLCHFGALLWI
jgi:hypothetical protein